MRRFLKAGIFGVTVSLLTTGAFAADPVKLRVHHFLGPVSNAQVNLIKPWCDKIQKESNGGLECQIYPSMQLGGTPAQLFDQVRDGVADIVWSAPTYQAGRFLKFEIFELPFMTTTSEKTSPAVWEYVQQNALDEFKGAKLIFTHVADGGVFNMTSRQINTMEDLKGMKIRASTRLGAKTLGALGAVPVQAPVPAVPESLSKGVFDGALIPWEVVTPLRIQEIVKYHVGMPAGKPNLANTTFVLAMNQGVYNKLSPELQKVIDNNSGLEASRWAGKVFDMPAAEAIEIAKKRGNQLTSISVEEYERWVKAVTVVVDEWKKDVAKKGADGAKLYESANALLAKHNQ